MASANRVLRDQGWAVALGACLSQPVTDLPRWMEQHTRLLKSDRYSRVGLLKVLEQSCWVKLYIPKSSLQKLGFRFGLGRGVRSFDAAVSLGSAGIDVPAPRACLFTPEGMLLLTEGMEDGRDLRALWLAQPTSPVAEDYLRACGETLSFLHRQGFVHGDCKWSNLLWSRGQCYLVDLEDARRVSPAKALGSTPGAEQLQDIARFTADAESLGATPGQYHIFLDSYCEGTGGERAQLVEGARPLLENIRQRHFGKDGKRHTQLI